MVGVMSRLLTCTTCKNIGYKIEKNLNTSVGHKNKKLIPNKFSKNQALCCCVSVRSEKHKTYYVDLLVLDPALGEYDRKTAALVRDYKYKIRASLMRIHQAGLEI